MSDARTVLLWHAPTRERDALLAVLDLHAPSSTDDVTVDGDEQWCTECVRDWDGEDWDRVAYPCATVRAITKALVVSE